MSKFSHIKAFRAMPPFRNEVVWRYYQDIAIRKGCDPHHLLGSHGKLKLNDYLVLFLDHEIHNKLHYEGKRLVIDEKEQVRIAFKNLYQLLIDFNIEDKKSLYHKVLVLEFNHYYDRIDYLKDFLIKLFNRLQVEIK